MDSLMERKDEKRIEREKKKHRKAMIFTVVLVMFAAFAFAGYLINHLVNRKYTDYEIVTSIPRQDSDTVQYLPYKEGAIIKYTRDGASAMDAAGNVLWNGSYELNNPAADICGSYVVIADIGGKEAYVFNGTDSGTKITTLLPILEAEVAKQGVVALVLEGEDSNEIQLHDPYEGSKSLLVKILTNAGNDGYPVDISISEDAKKLVTSYVTEKNGELKSKVTFYNFDEVGKDKVNNIVGGIDYGKEVVAKVEFLDNDTVCLMQQKGMILYSMQELPEEIAVLAADAQLDSVMYNENSIGYIADKTLFLYSFGGRKKLELPITWEYDEAELIGEDIIFRSGLACHVLRIGGSVKLSCGFDKNILYMFPTEKKDHYIFIDETNIEEVRLLEEKR